MTLNLSAADEEDGLVDRVHHQLGHTAVAQTVEPTAPVGGDDEVDTRGGLRNSRSRRFSPTSTTISTWTSADAKRSATLSR